MLHEEPKVGKKVYLRSLQAGGSEVCTGEARSKGIGEARSKGIGEARSKGMAHVQGSLCRIGPLQLNEM